MGEFKIGPIGNKEVKLKDTKGTSVISISEGGYGGEDGVTIHMKFPNGMTQCLGVINKKGITIVKLADSIEFSKSIKLTPEKYVKVNKLV